MDRRPVFFLQLVDREGVVARLPAGDRLERELIEAITEALAARLPSQLGLRATIQTALDTFAARLPFVLTRRGLRAAVQESLDTVTGEPLVSTPRDLRAMVQEALEAVVGDLKRASRGAL